MSASPQIFQTANPNRWQRVKWASRFLIFIIIIALVVVCLALVHPLQPSIPELKNQTAKKTLQTDAVAENTKLGKQYAGFRKFFQKENSRFVHNKTKYEVAANRFSADSTGIRAAFYVSWDAQSLISLRNNISKINMVVPEWLFIDPNTDTMYTSIEPAALALIKQSGIKVVPILSNNYQSKFIGASVHRILHDENKQQRLINDVVKFLQKNQLDGVNIDFEELQETSDEYMIAFQKKLYQQCHAKGFLVTQDVIPFNEDYNYQALSQYNDYIFLMAYDEHNEDSKPGAISSQKFIEAAAMQMAKKMPVSKIILAMAAYGYDWQQGKETQDITYQQALTTARESEGQVVFDSATYNLGYSYYDDDDQVHQVFFTDAATNFNTMRFAAEYQLAGTAIWRLGSEDSRIWNFYNRDMRKEAISQFNFAGLEYIQGSNDVDYIGEGEILDVQSSPHSGRINCKIDSSAFIITKETYDTLPSTFVIKKLGLPTGKQMVLTFDDGPDATYTPQILNILSKYHVPAAFFLIGEQAEENIPLVKRIYREGHEIGNHSFTHPNLAKVSHERASLEMDATRLLIECITGHSTILFRAPYNADSEPESMEELTPVAQSRTKDYLTVGESIDPEDWEPGVNADTVFNRVVRYQSNGNIILLHDAGGNRKATVEALPRIITYFKSKGYTFTTVASLLGKKRDQLMPPVPEGSGYKMIETVSWITQSAYYIGNLLFWLFALFLTLGTIRITAMAVLAIRQQRKEKRLFLNASIAQQYPAVGIIVPAYNEEVNAVASLTNLLKCTYPNFHITFVDDGSKDETYSRVAVAFANNPNITVHTKPNGGKASALNFGIGKTEAAYLVCIDADTRLKPDAVALMMQHFLAQTQTKLGAVAGNVKVGNTINFITNWQSIEYTTSQNFDRKAFAAINAITVVPGAIGLFLRKALEDAGGFTTDTLAEDCDLTIRILRLGYTIENENNAIALTEAPESVKQFMKQRSRWSFGVMQTFWKHRDALFNNRNKTIGFIALPNILLFQFIIPFFLPIADFMMFLGIATGNGKKIGGYYLLFLVVDILIALVAFWIEKENIKKLLWLVPQRFVYRWLMFIVLFGALRKAIKGELQQWGILKRSGNVKDPELLVGAK